jgi:hypothetical protein
MVSISSLDRSLSKRNGFVPVTLGPSTDIQARSFVFALRKSWDESTKLERERLGFYVVVA